MLARISAAEPLPEAEAQLNLLFDHCDRIADQIALFEGQGYAVQVLVGPYRRLIQRAQDLQELIDQALAAELKVLQLRQSWLGDGDGGLPLPQAVTGFAFEAIRAYHTLQHD